MAAMVLVAAGRERMSRVGRRPRKAACRLTRAAWAITPGRHGEQHRLGSRGDGEGVSGGGADDRAEAHQGQPARYPPARLLTEQRPGGQALPESMRGQCQRDHSRASHCDGGAL
jgi:hypothetical protein